MDEIARLYKTVVDIARDPKLAHALPRTARLVASSRNKLAKKVGEEAVEVALEAGGGRRQPTIEESADLIYHLTVLWADMEIAPEEIWAEMAHRREVLGVAEKLPKPGSVPTVLNDKGVRALLKRAVKSLPLPKRDRKAALEGIAALNPDDAMRSIILLSKVGRQLPSVVEEIRLLEGDAAD